ncbi:MAG TPA: phage holin family protein [Anaeromyxobacter sp.]|nr:phage holin family protein [Anaeromyxobacter sp.]
MRPGREFSRGERLHDRPLGDVVRELGQESQGLVRDELRLAKAELRAELKKVQKGSAEIGAGGAVGYIALFLLGITLVAVGATFMPVWLSALIVTVIYAAVAGGLIAAGRAELKKARPTRAVEHIKEDGRWAKETMHDIKSSRGANASRSSPARYHDA